MARLHDYYKETVVKQLMERSGYPERMARAVGTVAHSDPAEAGKVLAECNPRLAVAFHFFNDFDTAKRFDRIVSIEMFEHLRNWPRAFAKVSRWLRDDGRHGGGPLDEMTAAHGRLMFPFRAVPALMAPVLVWVELTMTVLRLPWTTTFS